jgi:pilus assembly protein CpaB
MEDVVDRAPRIDITKHDYILDHMLSKKGAKTIAAAIPRGKCAFPVQGSNVSGFVQPGDRVDVIVTIKQKSGEFRSVTVLTMIDVMAVNGSLVPTLESKSDGKEPHSVTLLLTQDQARELEEGQKQGNIRLTLRNIGDNQPAPVTKLADLKLDTTQEEPKTPELKPAVVTQTIVQPPAPPQIRTLRGTQAGVEFVPASPETPVKP